MRGNIDFFLAVAVIVSVSISCVLGVSSRLPRTSAGFNRTNLKRNIQTSARATTTSSIPPVSKDDGSDDYGKIRERYLFELFEVLISTLDSKLQRIENLDKAVEHLMRRVEVLDTRVSSNIEKTGSVLSKLDNLDVKLFKNQQNVYLPNNENSDPTVTENSNINRKLQSLESKVDGIDGKLNDLKNHFDGGNGFLPNDEFNAEASEKKPVHMNVVEITKALNTEVINHVSKELGQLRESSSNIDRKLQFHINLVSDNLDKMLHRINDIHHAIIDHVSYNYTTTTTPNPIEERMAKNNKIDALTEQIKPIVMVSEKIQEVWNVVVGTKSSVDNLLPKSDELLTQTQRQERAIGEIHNDLRTKTNKIIANLDKVDRRLKKQENDVANLSQGPVRAELLLDPTIDRLIEFDPKRYVEDYPETSTEQYTTFYPTLAFNPQNNVAVNQSAPISTPLQPIVPTTSADKKIEKRKDGVIFPSIKNKPGPANTTFATEVLDLSKDVKGYSCVDLLNAEMRKSGVYYLQIRGTTYWFLKVFCEQEIADGGWTVIQRRDDFGDPRENFNRDWNDYKNGFGDPAKEFWLGNENIYMLTNNEEYILRVELEDFEGNRRYAQYSHFKIYSEAEYYKLEIDGYEGTAGDSLNDPWYGSNNSPFSTYNRDNDRSSLNCASMLKGGWWWKSCGRGLNGLYLNDPQDLTARQGIVWFRWRGWDYTLKKAMMMIKPKGLASPSN